MQIFMNMESLAAETSILMYANACRAIRKRICKNPADTTQRTLPIPDLNLSTKNIVERQTAWHNLAVKGIAINR